MIFRRTRTRRPGLPPDQLAATWQVVSLLLDYPDEQLVAREPLLREVVAGLPEPVARPLTTFLDGLAGPDAEALRRLYVHTFDTSRRCCLYLTYFTHGDTRKRGMALVEFKEAYRQSGMELSADELPDHLSVVLEFGACHDADTSWRLLNTHRAGIEVLHHALVERDVPWRHVLAALLATLPPMAGDDGERILRLIQQGPPKEDVGFDSDTPYLVDPGVTGHLAPSGPVPVSLGPTRRLTPTAGGTS